MSRSTAAREPFTLYTTTDPLALYDRARLLRDVADGRPPRLHVDRAIAKVLPAGSRFTVADESGDVVRIVDCEYRPYFEKELYGLRALLGDADSSPPPPRPRPSPAAMVESLRALEGTRYLFGGSAPQGSAAQAKLLLERGRFAPADFEHPDLLRLARSSGIDCSGLLNVATAYGFFGDSKDVYARFRDGLLAIDGSPQDAKTLAAALEPLDVVLFVGHLLIGLGGGKVIQAVGDGRNAGDFARATGFAGRPLEKYDRVVIDDAEPILEALLVLQGRRYSPEWRFDDTHFLIVRDARLRGESGPQS
jgi:hypothetical protein